MSKFKIYFRSASTSLVSNFVTKGAAFLSVWLLNKVLSKQSYGDYEFAFSLISILIILGSAGLQHITMYRISRMDAPPESLVGHNLAGRLLRYSLYTSSIVCVLVILLAPTFSNFVDNFWIIGLSFLLPVKALHGIYDAWYKARQLIAESIVYFRMFPAIAKVGFLFFCWILWPTANAVVGAILLSEIVPLVYRFYKAPLNFLTGDSGSDLTTWDFKYAGQLALTTGISKTVKYADILMMGFLASSAKTAEYVIASKIAVTLIIAHHINNNIITPRIGNFLSNNDLKSIHKEYHQSRVLTLSFAFLGAITFSILGHLILDLFGEYRESYSTLMILCATYVIHASFGMSGGYLNIAGYSGLTLLTTVIVLVVNVGLNFWLIPIIGADGAALAMLISFSIANIITAQLILVRDKIPTYSIFLSFIVGSFVVFLLLNAFSVVRMKISVLIITCFFLVFLFSERKFILGFLKNLSEKMLS